MSRITDSARDDRRRFLKMFALASLSGALGASRAFAQGPAPGGPTHPPPRPQPVAPVPPEAKAEISEDARALATFIQRRYAKDLNAEQVESIASDCDADLKAGRRLRDVRLANDVEPDVTFRA